MLKGKKENERNIITPQTSIGYLVAFYTLTINIEGKKVNERKIIIP